MSHLRVAFVVVVALISLGVLGSNTALGGLGIGGVTCNGRELVRGDTLTPGPDSQFVSSQLVRNQGVGHEIELQYDGVCTFSLCAPGASADFRPWLCLYDSGSRLVTEDNRACPDGAEITRELSAGTYFLAVSSSGSALGGYTLLYSCASDVVCNGRPAVQSGTIVPSALPQSVSGSVTSETSVGYTVELEQDGACTFSLCEEGATATYDTWLCLFDAEGQLVGQNDDRCALRSKITTELTAGTYTIVVSGFSTREGDFTMVYSWTPMVDCNGRPAVQSGTIVPSALPQSVSGSVTSDTAVAYTVDLEQDGTCAFSLCGDEGGTATYDTWMCLFDAEGEFIAQNDDRCGLRSQITRDLTAGTYTIVVSGFSTREGDFTLAYFWLPVVDCNGRPAVRSGTIVPDALPQTVSGFVASETSVGYTVEVEQDGTCTFSLCEEEGGTSTYNTWLCLFDAAGEPIVEDDDACGLRSQITAELSAGIYTVVVSGFASQPGDFTMVYSNGVAGGGEFIRCDTNCDGEVNVSDPSATFGFLFLGDDPPCCDEVANCNGTGITDLSDGIYNLNFLFLGGPPPPAPYPDCGSVDSVDCIDYVCP